MSSSLRSVVTPFPGSAGKFAEPSVNGAAWKRPDWGFWCAVLLGCVLLAGAISHASLWIDEGYSLWIANHRTLASVANSLVIGDSSDRQMAPHYYYLWGWVHLFGSGEYAARLSNFPFILLFVVAIALTSREVFRERYAWLVAILCPFVWYHVNEARPYFMLIAFSAATVGSLITHLYGPAKWKRRTAWLFPVFLWITMSIHMLAGFLGPAVVVLGWLNRKRIVWRQWRWPVLVFTPLFALLGLYYVATFALGNVSQNDSPSLAYAVAGLYEHLGFGGLGPPRDVLRTADPVGARHVFWAGVGLAGWIYIVAGCGRRWRDRRAASIACAWVASMVFAVAVSYVVNSRLVGRHIAALLPLLLILLIAAIPQRRYWVALALIWIAADYRLAFVDEYGKDEYRGTVAFLDHQQQKTPGTITFIGDPLTAEYYGLSLADVNNTARYGTSYSDAIGRVDWPSRVRGTVAINWTPAQVRAYMARRRTGPMYLAVSKLRLYDLNSAWPEVLASPQCHRIAHFRRFNVYQID